METSTALRSVSLSKLRTNYIRRFLLGSFTTGIFGYLAMFLNFAPVQAQPTTGVGVGQIFGNEQGQIINGWEHTGGGLYPKRKTANYVTTETDECCFAIFKKNGTILIA